MLNKEDTKYWIGTDLYIKELTTDEMKKLKEGYCPHLNFVKHKKTEFGKWVDKNL